MQQDALIGLGQSERVTDISSRPALDITQSDHLPPRERRNTPVSDTWLATVADEPAVDPDRFFGLENPALIDRWASAPRGVAPEEQLLAAETQAIISRAIEALPFAQREVITLRDMEGWSAADVCNALELTETNQRVLLHRARSKVRAAVEPYLSPTA